MDYTLGNTLSINGFAEISSFNPHKNHRREMLSFPNTDAETQAKVVKQLAQVCITSKCLDLNRWVVPEPPGSHCML